MKLQLPWHVRTFFTLRMKKMHDNGGTALLVIQDEPQVKNYGEKSDQRNQKKQKKKNIHDDPARPVSDRQEDRKEGERKERKQTRTTHSLLYLSWIRSMSIQHNDTRLLPRELTVNERKPTPSVKGIKTYQKLIKRGKFYALTRLTVSGGGGCRVAIGVV